MRVIKKFSAVLSTTVTLCILHVLVRRVLNSSIGHDQTVNTVGSEYVPLTIGALRSLQPSSWADTSAINAKKRQKSTFSFTGKRLGSNG